VLRLLCISVLAFFPVELCVARPSADESSQAQSAKAPSAQQPAAVPAAPQARAADVSSPSAILAAAYDVISGPAGTKRDWDRFLSLFAPEARLVPVAAKQGGGFRAFAMTPDVYAARADSYFEKNGFYEREISRKTERWGDITQVFSTYESRRAAADPAPFERGINSFQLLFDGHRWWIVTIMWQGETPANRLTPEFLPRRKS
jgi:hypothetical protein